MSENRFKNSHLKKALLEHNSAFPIQTVVKQITQIQVSLPFEMERCNKKQI